MKRQFYSVIGGLSMLGLVAGAAEAAPVGTVSILPSVNDVSPGATLDLFVVGSGFEDNAQLGDFTVIWDPGVISYVGIDIANPPWDNQVVDDTDADTTGTLNRVFLSSMLGGVGSDFDIATLSFTVVGNPDDSTDVSAMDGLLGWRTPGAVPIVVTYNNAMVNVAPIPVPAAVWLFGSALLGLAGVARRRKTA